MGMAILLIMFCHSQLAVPKHTLMNMYDAGKKIAQVGVDIFLLLSGMGCYFSLQKCAQPLLFYKRRILRVLPAFLLIVPFRIITAAAVQGYSFPEAVWEYSLISFFLDGKLAVWFIAGILLLYLLYPAIDWLLYRHERAFVLAFVLYIAAIGLMPLLQGRGLVLPGFLSRNIFNQRVIPFLAGAWYGKKVNTGEIKLTSLPAWSHEGLLLAFCHLIMLCVLIWKYIPESVLMWYAMRFVFLPLSVVIILMTAVFCEGRKQTRVLPFLGKITLELYLLHEWLLYIGRNILFPEYMEAFIPSLLINIAAVLLAIVISAAVHRLLAPIGRAR